MHQIDGASCETDLGATKSPNAKICPAARPQFCKVGEPKVIPSRRNLSRVGVGLIFVSASPVLMSVAGAEPKDSPFVAAARLLGPQFRGNPVNVTGHDAASSILLPTRDALWLFGDTIEGPFETIRGLPLADKLSNTGIIVPPHSAEDGLRQFQFITSHDGQRARQLIGFVDGESSARQRIWPIHGACIGDQIYIFYHRISLIPGVDVFDNFNLDGMGIARAKLGQWDFERLNAPDGTLEFWKGNEPTFGVFAEQHDGHVYLWGSLMTGMFLARVRPDAIADLAAYEYLIEAPTTSNPDCAPRWSGGFEPSASLFDSVPNEMSASFNKHLGCYIAIHSYLRENKLVMRTAPSITGPWSDAQIVYRPQQLKDDDLIYAAKEHPELAREDGKIIYITFVNSTSYVPQLVELTFK